MKYIRMKDVIYEVTASSETNKLYRNSNCFRVYDRENLCDKDIYITDTEVFKQADTIEELVDELVVVEPNNEDCPRPYVLDCFYLCTYNSWFEREKERIKNGAIIVYGSIWVDGELHKVAKMNDKGELELL